MSHTNLSPKKLTTQTRNFNSLKMPKTVRKSYNDSAQRPYEDFEMEIEDSVVKIEKENLTQRNLHRATKTLNRNKMVKSLSPHFKPSIQAFGQPDENQNALLNQMFENRELNRKDNIDSAKETYRNLKSKAKLGLEKSNLLRRKHFKGHTLHKGEGQLFKARSIFDSSPIRANDKSSKN
jgi:hypothetical protein